MTDYLLINVPVIFLGTLCPNSVYNENVRRISSQLNWSIIFPFIKRAYRPSLQPRRRADSGSCRIFRANNRRQPGGFLIRRPTGNINQRCGESES